MFWLATGVYVFWLLTTYCLNACFLYSEHPLYEATCGPLQFSHVGFLDSLLGHPLSERELAVVALHYRNWGSKFFHLVQYAGYMAD